MAPITQAGIIDPEIRFLLNALVTCGPLNIDSKALAEAEGIARSDHAVGKLRRIIEKHGYSYQNKTVAEADGTESAVANTTKKAAATGKGKAKTATASKKRKLDDDLEDVEDGAKKAQAATD